LDNKVFDIIDARCNYEVHWSSLAIIFTLIIFNYIYYFYCH